MRSRKPPASRQRTRADERLVDEQDERPHEHPADHRPVDAAAQRGQHEGEHGRPGPAGASPPRPGGAPHAVVDDEQEPRQGGVADERDARAPREHHGVGVQDVDRGGDGVRDAARAADEDVHEAQDAPGRQAEDRRQPQALDDPGREADPAQHRVERGHGPEVAAVLGALDRAEVGARRPDRGDLADEARRIDVQVDLRVARRPSRTLQQGQGAGERDVGEGHGRVAGRSAHRRAEGTD